MATQARIVVTALREHVALVAKKIALDIVANLTASPSEGGTPVDTGWARANWVPNVGAPFEGTSGTREEVTQSGQQLGIRKVLTYKVTEGPIHVTNNVPYIVFLNEGSSQQAPQGFVQAAIQKAVTTDLARTSS